MSRANPVFASPAPEPNVGDAESTGRKASQAQVLVQLATEQVVEFFHSDDGKGYARVSYDGILRVFELREKRFCALLRQWFYRLEGKVPGSQAVQDAVGVLEGRALFEGREHPIHVRLAEMRGTIYLDLADERGRVVEIDSHGWRVVTDYPVMFRRPRTLAALPVPEYGGSIDELRPLVNIDEAEWPLLASFLLGCLNPTGPYPLLVLVAEQGSGKSTQARLVKSLIDPSLAPLRSMPRDLRDLMISASNSRIMVFDNLSSLRVELSDALCRLSTGGGFATRELYADGEETVFQAMRPVVLNGIDDVVTRADLIDRCVIVNLPRIRQEDRRTERELMQAYQAAQPRILGAVLTATSEALKNLPNVRLPSNPRMADFAAWVTAGVAALGIDPETFLRAYEVNRKGAHELALGSSPLPGILQAFVQSRGAWQGTAGRLMDELEQLADESLLRGKRWPKSASSLGNMLRRIAPNLRDQGLHIEFDRTGSQRLIRLGVRDAVTGVTPSFQSSGSRPGRDQRAVGQRDAVESDLLATVTTQGRCSSTCDGDDTDDGALRKPSLFQAEVS